MVFKVKDAESAVKGSGIDAKKFYDTDNVIMAHITLEKGAKLSKHSSKEFALLYVISGKVFVEIEDETYELEEESLIEFLPGKLHSVENMHDGISKVIVIKIK